MEISYLNAALVPVIVGVVQAIKIVGMDSKWSPLASMALGVLAVGFTGAGFSGIAIVTGVGTGLAAAGLYSGTKAILTPSTE